MPTKSYIIKGPEDNFDIPKESVGKFVFDLLKRTNSNKIAAVDVITNDTLTYGKLLENTVKLAEAYGKFGLKGNDVIAIVAENGINYYAPFIAALYVGIIINPLNPAYMKGELTHALSLSRAKLIICSSSCLPLILQVKEELNTVETVLLIEGRSEDAPEIRNLQNILDSVTADTKSFKPSEFDCAVQGAIICMSSGTTGLPKGVLITHQGLRVPLGYLRLPEYGNVKENEVTLLILPFFHIAGLMTFLSELINFSKAVIIKKFDPKMFVQALQQHKVTKLFLVPTLLLFLIKSPLCNNQDFSRIRDIIFGASPTRKQLHDAVIKKLANATVRQMYGLTETSGGCTLQTITTQKAESIGHLVPTMQAKVWDPNSKKNVGPLAVGELCFKGPMIMKGYVNNADATKNCIDEDGFLHTGDLGYYDNDECFYIVDRIKELIKYKGFQVPPAELEALILTHPEIKECGVVGVPDERSGQVPVAFVVRQTESNISEKEIVDFVAERISIQKRLHGGVRFVDEILKNSSGKIIKRKLLELYHQNI